MSKTVINKEVFSVDDMAILIPLEWETDEMQDGVKAFLDVDFMFDTIPDALKGCCFIRSSFYGTRKVCREPGMVYVITPAKKTGVYSRANELELRGFEKMDIPPFSLFGEQWPQLPCILYRKEFEREERLDLSSPGVVLKNSPVSNSVEKNSVNLARWCIILADTPKTEGRVGDLPQRSKSTFDPPLAQNHTVAAEVPNLEYFVHDPGMIQLPGGEFIVFAPCWRRTNPRTTTFLLLSRSRDGGKSWQRLPDLPYAEATPFLVGDDLYLFTQPKQHKDVYFMRSRDAGETWSEPAKIFEGPYWNCQTNMVRKDGQLYWVLDKKHQGTAAIAADLSKDLLKPDAWRMSNVLDPVMTPPEFRRSGTRLFDAGDKQTAFCDWNLEGNVMLVGDRLRIAARVNPKLGLESEPALIDSLPPWAGYSPPSIAALFDLEDEDGKLRLTYDQHYPWPGAQTKFAIVHDPATAMFWMACNPVTGFHDELGAGTHRDRRYLMLYFGSDGMNWMPAGCIAMAPTSTQSFMYPSMVIDGDDLAILSRSGRYSGHFHDADQATFHRVKDFRSLAWY